MRLAFAALLSIACLATAQAAPRTCFSPDFVRSFQVVSPTQVNVDTGRHRYAVILRRECPGLIDARHVGFSSEPAAWHHLGPAAFRDPGLSHAAVVSPVSRVCGRGQWLVPAGDGSGFPASGCAIEQVIQLP